MCALFSVDFEVRDYELDQFGVVNNAVYQNYLEHARHQFLHQIGIGAAGVASSGKSLALSEITVKDLSALRSRETFRVEVAIEKIGGARVVFLQKLHALGENRLVLTARAVAVFLNENGRPTRVTPEHRDALTSYLSGNLAKPL